MKKRIIAFLFSIFIIGCLPISNVTALSTEDKPYFYDVQIDKKGEILGDGDTINVSCKLAKCDIVVDDCICWINAYSSNIHFSLYYNEATGCYEGSYTFGETYDNPQRACYIMKIESYKNKIITYCNEDTHPLGMHEFYYCNKCKDGIHYPVIDEAKGSTCSAEGMTEGSHCSLCSTVIKAQETIPANGHTWDNGKVTKEVTCKEDGMKTYTCTVCNETKAEAITKLTSHSFDGGKVTKEATCKEEGVKTYTCTVCKEAKTEAIAKLTSHTPGPEATATEDQVCTICGKVLAKATGETQPSEEPTEPTVQPTEPTTQPTTKPTTQPTEPSNDADSTVPATAPTEPDHTGDEDVGAWIIVTVVVTVILGSSATAGIILWKKKH